MYAKESELNVATYQITGIIKESAELALKGMFIKFTIQSDTNLWPVNVDKFKFIQVFMNLFINARQAMLSDDSITVYCSNTQDSKSAKILVQDDGVGIESDIIKSKQSAD